MEMKHGSRLETLVGLLHGNGANLFSSAPEDGTQSISIQIIRTEIVSKLLENFPESKNYSTME